MARFNTNGTLDSTFGTAGIVSTDFGAGYTSPSGLVIQPDGKILIAGNVPGADPVVITRYLADGTLDSAFGTGGVAPSTGSSYGGSLALQADGKIVLGNWDAIRRYSATGAVDATWGTAGAVAISATPVNMYLNANILMFVGYTSGNQITAFGYYQ
jgi:uncharacterized delta-60 repeat protein